MSVSNISSDSTTHSNIEQQNLIDNSVASTDLNKITIASTAHCILKEFQCTMKGVSFLIGNWSSSICIEKISKPFRDSTMKAVELLSIPILNVSESELAEYNNFRSNSLNIVYVTKFDNQLPDDFLKTIKELNINNKLFVFDKRIPKLSVYKHLFKISKFLPGSLPYIVDALMNNQATLTKLKNVIVNSNKLQSIDGVLWFKKNALPITRMNFSCNIADMVSLKLRMECRELLEKALMEKCNSLKIEINDIQENVIKVFGENNNDYSLGDLCEFKARKVEEAIFEAANGSLEKYKKIHHDSKEIRRLCFSTENPIFNLENPLGKRTREGSGVLLSLPARKRLTSETLEASVTEKDRLKYKTSLKVRLFQSLLDVIKKMERLEEQFIRLLGGTNSNLTLEDRCNLRAKIIEDYIYEITKNDIAQYSTAYTHEKFKIEKNEIDQGVSFIEKSKAVLGSMFNIKLPENYSFRPQYKWIISGFPTDYHKAFQDNNGSYQYWGPVDENGNHILEDLYRNSKKREVNLKLNGFPAPVLVNLDTFEVTYMGVTKLSLGRFVKFHGEKIEIPPFWSDFQDSMIGVYNLNLNKLPPLEIGVGAEKKVFVDILNEEIKKIHPEATVEYVKRIQNFEQLNDFELRRQFMSVSNSDSIPVKLLKKVTLHHNHTEPCFLFYGSNEADPAEIIYDLASVSLCNAWFDPNQNWGEGIHLSSSFRYANECSYGYDDLEQNVIRKQVFIVEADLGYSYFSECDPSLKIPALRGHSNNSPVPYDSITGKYSTESLNADVYTIFQRSQILPVCVIQYSFPSGN